MPKKNIVIGICKLCDKENVRLVDGHIIPDFVYRWLRNNSVTGHFRTTIAPNNRIQYGLSKNWFCANCDNVEFGGKLETPFADGVFNPILLEGKQVDTIEYDNYLLRFCVSVLWRVLLVGIEDAKNSSAQNNNKYSQIIESMQDLADSWKTYLNDEKSTWKGNNVYFLQLGSGDLSPQKIGAGLNLYSHLTIDMGSIVDPTTMDPLIYAKMGPFFTFLPITPFYYKLWSDCEILPLKEEGGEISFVKCTLPEHFKYLLAIRAKASLNLNQKLSDKQKEKLFELKEKNNDALLHSLEYRLTMMDILELEGNNV